MPNQILTAIVSLLFCVTPVLAATATGTVDPAAKWKVVNGTKIPVPPHEHPRVYLRAKQVPELKQRIACPALKDIV